MGPSEHITEPGSAEEAGFSPADLLRIARERWRLILAITVLGVTVASLIALALPNKYIATATVQVEQRRKQIVAINAVVQDLRVDTPTVESEVEVLRSSALALRVIEKLRLRDDPEFRSKPLLSKFFAKDSAKTKPPQTAPAPRPAAENATVPTGEDGETPTLWTQPPRRPGARKKDYLLNNFQNRLYIRRVRNSRNIEISFQASNPVRAAEIADAIARTYLAMQLEAKTRASKVAQTLLSQRIIKLRKRLAAAERKFEDFKSRNDMFDADGKPILERQLARETEALVRAQERKAAAKAKVELIARMRRDGRPGFELADVVANPSVRTLSEALSRALRRQAELGTKYGALHPAMQEVTAEIRKARTELKRAISSILTNLDNEYQLAADLEKRLLANVANLKKRISASKSKAWELAELQRDVATSRRLYEHLLARRKQTRETQGLQFPDATIVANASVPLGPTSPKRKRLVLVAAFASFGFAAAVAFLLDMLAPKVRPGATARPRTRRAPIEVDAGPAAAGLENLARLPAIPALGPDEACDDLRAARLVMAAPGSPFTQAIAALQADLLSAPQMSRHADRGARALFASALAGEDRALIAANVALSAAIAGYRTVLVDADMHASAISNMLRLGTAPGLREALSGAANLTQTIVQDHRSGLFVIPAGTNLDSHIAPSELLTSRNAGPIFTWLGQAFDLVVIDAPAALAAPDAAVLAHHADAVVVVARWRATPSAFIARAVESLGTDAAKIVGASVSAVPAQILMQPEPVSYSAMPQNVAQVA